MAMRRPRLDRTLEWKHGWLSGAAAGDGSFFNRTQKHKMASGRVKRYTRRKFGLGSNDLELLKYFEEFAVGFGVEGFCWISRKPKGKKLYLNRGLEVEALEELCALPPNPSDEFKLGWLAGIFDTDGYGGYGSATKTGRRNVWQTRIAQSKKANPHKCAIIEHLLTDLGFDSHYIGNNHYLIRDGFSESLRFFEMCQPILKRKYPEEACS